MSHLYDLAIKFAAKTPPPGDLRAPGQNWNGACGAQTNQFALYIGGWDRNPSDYGATTVGSVYAKSTIKSKNSALAPINAKHWFKLSTGAWHVFTDLNGGGTDCFSASGRAKKVDLGNFLCIQSVGGYLSTGGATYMGWSTDYAGATSKYVEPVVTPPVTVLGPQQRKTGPIGAKIRTTAEVLTTNELEDALKGNFVYTMSGWRHGGMANGSDIWFRHEFGWSHSSAFLDKGTHDLPDLTPAPIVTPPVVVPPVVINPSPAISEADVAKIVAGILAKLPAELTVTDITKAVPSARAIADLVKADAIALVKNGVG